MTVRHLPSTDELRLQIQELSSNIPKPKRLEEVLLEACNGLVAVLESLESSPAMNQQKTLEIETSIQNNVLGILTALAQSQKRQRDQLDRYKIPQDKDTEIICQLDQRGVIIGANEAFLRYFAQSPEIKPGSNILDQLPSDQAAQIRGYIASLGAANPLVRFDIPIHFIDGSTHWVQWTGVGTFTPAGELTSIQVFGQDITVQKQDELAVQHHNRELNALHNATVALLTTIDPEALLSRIVDAALSAIPTANKGMIHLIAADTGQLEMRASVGYSDPRIVKIRVPGAAGYIARAVKERTPLIVHNLHTDPDLSKGPFQQIQEVNSAIVAPLILKSQVLGALSLESTSIGAFEQSDLNLLVSFAATATAAIHNATLHAEVQKLAITDSLTGLYNRRGFYELGQREVERARRYRRPLVAMMLDVDHFKSINDFYGHSVGDQVLQSVAKRCTDNLRRIDILSRLGGDEFTILLPETDMFTASNVAERVRQCITTRAVITDRSPVSVSASLGVARATATTPDLEVLIGRAEKALAIAKREGRNRVEFG